MIVRRKPAKEFSTGYSLGLVDYLIYGSDQKLYFSISYLFDVDYHGHQANYRYVVTDKLTNHKFPIYYLEIVERVAEMLDDLIKGKGEHTLHDIEEFALIFGKL